MKLIAVILIAVMLSGCARSCQFVSRNLADNTSHEVKITMYSGGDTVYHKHLKSGIINNYENSDGYYFYDNGGKLVELSGDVVIEYIN